MMPRLASAALISLVTVAGVGTARADTPFVGPSGWSHVDQQSPDPARKFDQWRLAADPPQTVTVIHDSTTAYADALALIKKNFADNHIKANVDKDALCQGRQGHLVEFATGPEGHRIIISRMLVPDGNGVVTITYARGDGFNYDDDVKKAVDTYCAGS